MFIISSFYVFVTFNISDLVFYFSELDGLGIIRIKEGEIDVGEIV